EIVQSGLTKNSCRINIIRSIHGSILWMTTVIERWVRAQSLGNPPRFFGAEHWIAVLAVVFEYRWRIGVDIKIQTRSGIFSGHGYRVAVVMTRRPAVVAHFGKQRSLRLQ